MFKKSDKFNKWMVNAVGEFLGTIMLVCIIALAMVGMALTAVFSRPVRAIICGFINVILFFAQIIIYTPMWIIAFFMMVGGDWTFYDWMCQHVYINILEVGEEEIGGYHI